MCLNVTQTVSFEFDNLVMTKFGLILEFGIVYIFGHVNDQRILNCVYAVFNVVGVV